MKSCCLLAFLLFSLVSRGSPSPVSFALKAEKTRDSVYLIRVSGSIAPGWHMYARPDKALGLEAISITCDNENIVTNADWLEEGSRAVQLADPLFENKKITAYRDSFTLTQFITIKGRIPASLVFMITGFAAGHGEFLQVNEKKEIWLDESATITENPLKLPSVNLQEPVADCGEKLPGAATSLWNIFVKGFAGGLIALLMPCIFPMVPVTISFFMNRANTRKQGIGNGWLYGGFILLVYLLASLPFHIAGNINPQFFNSISTDVRVNLAFFAIFLVFALSLFGLFELRLPGALANQAGRKSGAGSIAGIFFMALTLAIVSFSCTGPILGFLLVNSIGNTNGAWALTAGMAGFGLALALPFGLFAMFPQWMKKMPKSGGWMETLKKTLAFVELALAFKFLSNADLVGQWGILKREVFIGIWALLALALSLYLAGIFGQKESSDTGTIKVHRVSLTRKLAALAAFLFTLYLLPGITQSKWSGLKWVSGFPPPMSYSFYADNNKTKDRPEPDVINDYESAVALAKREGKPLLLDFTGWACINCRKMEENVWTNAEVAELMKNNFILVSLYVDDRTSLPVDKRIILRDEQGGQRHIRTYGEKWAAFQAENFGSASQPQYVILSPEENLLNNPVGYSPAGKYKEWLHCGLEAFRGKRK